MADRKYPANDAEAIMKIGGMRYAIESAQTDFGGRIRALKEQKEKKTPLDLNPVERILLRTQQLGASTVRPSKSEQERILGTNDLVDLNFFQKGLNAARSVCRVVLRNGSDRHIGYASGFVVAPRLILTNHHVFPTLGDGENAIAQFEYQLDADGIERQGVSFRFRPDIFHFAEQSLDFALIAVEQQSEDRSRALTEFPPLRLNPMLGKINEGEFISIVQHPSGSPKQVALRENKLLSIDENFLIYASDTAQGSSGSPLFNDSWQIIGLHSAGVPRKNDAGQWMTKGGKVADADTDDSKIDWIGNRGARASRIVNSVKARPNNVFFEEFLDIASHDEISAPEAGDLFTPTSPGPVAALRVRAAAGGARIDLPAGYVAEISGAPSSARAGQRAVAHVKASADAVEAYKSPVIDNDYANRSGYDADFLGVKVAMPRLSSKALAAKMDDGEVAIPYEHFSVVMRKDRRLAFFTACNIDASQHAKKPEPGRDYSRKGLSGLGDNDREKWIAEPRLAAGSQLPDKFFEKDRQSFDKGHIVRREDVTFGDDYAQVRRANGDSFHVTNCSPQVAAFNRSNLQGVWGLLENHVLSEAKSERLAVFAGPVFRDNDKIFGGVDQDGAPLDVKIPSRFWKVVVALGDDGLESFAFVLKQDLSAVTWEFDAPAKWIAKPLPLADLQAMISPVVFPASVINADRYDAQDEQEIFALAPELLAADLKSVTD